MVQTLPLLVILTVSAASTVPPTLKLVHVLFRHGNRNPDESTVWKGNPYRHPKYYPEGYGQLTNTGKRTEFHLGLFMRERYDEFLGAEWNINYLDVRTTDYNRTKMSALLVLAGLWRPNNTKLVTRDLPWQPIPYNYDSASEETILTAGTSFSNSKFTEMFNDVTTSADIAEYLSARYGDAMEMLNEYTELDVDDYYGAMIYWDCMKVQVDLGLALPEWAKKIYPQPLTDLGTEIYYLYTNTTELRKMVAGPLIKKILLDSVNFAAGTLTPSTRKMFVYSAHDINVGTFLLSLDAFDLGRTPPYGAAVFVELHEVDEVYGLQFYYQDYTSHSPHELTIPGCALFCPLEEFYALVEDILP